MSRKFKFYIDNNKYIWENYNMKLVFSNPHIQAHDDYVILENANGILYYYYTVEIFRKIYDDWDEEKDEAIYKWDLVSERHTHDFPCIEQLHYFLNYMNNDNIIDGGERHEYRSGKVEYSKRYNTEGFICEDFYEVTKYVDSDGKNPYYMVYIGCTFDGQGDLDSAGIRVSNILQNDIDELYKCVDSFINYSIKIHNEMVSKRREIDANNKEIIEGKLYQYKVDSNNQINKNEIDSIYVVGDNLELTILKKDETGKEYSSDVKIIVKAFKDNCIVSEKNEFFNIKNISFIMDEVEEKKKYYNVEEVTEDFYSIMTDIEFNDFKKLDEEKLFNKYCSAIIDRTWMCWDDTHNFPVIADKQKANWNIENAKEVVKIVIRNIKKNL